ncbi:MAG: hypothetical protein GF317_04275 [Candidatus Lokiarchaeota archaeon]|nr:hypothetical protein [Candidatus Lokiarchaeota archaeon]MBD3199105.1 hypothetical protein [Candidatus Lokiarchaeota archaeon]
MTENTPQKKFRYLTRYKDVLLQCISCGDCREAIDISVNPPKWGVCPVKDHTPGFEPYFGRGKMQIIRSVWQEKLNLSQEMAEVFYQCPTCNACSEACAYEFDNASIYEALRAELVKEGFQLQSHAEMNRAMIQLMNPYNRDNKLKGEWLNNLEFPVKNANEEKVEVLYFVGCTAALTPEIRAVAINTAIVLNKLHVNFGVLGKEEVCCGSVAMRTGDQKAFNTVAQKNIEIFEETGIKKIITSCAGCYRTLKIDYAESLEELDIEVLHSIEFIADIIKKKETKLKDLGISTTYHDPCHTGRHIGLYEEPRELVKKISNLIEMKTIKNNAKCCGAGGGVKKAFPELSLEVAKARVQEAEDTNADYLVSICPFCFRNLQDAIDNLNSDLIMIDLMELVNKALEKND